MSGADLNVARYYEIGIDTQYVPLNVYTRDVDYADVEVQVGCREVEEEGRGGGLS